VILSDEKGDKYEVPDETARKIPKLTRAEYLHTLIVEVIQEAANVQRIAAFVKPHSTPVNLGTQEVPRLETFTCVAEPAIDARIVEPVNPEAIASTIIARLRANGFTNEEDLNAPQGEAASSRERSHAVA
jgi:hypothetical protein